MRIAALQMCSGPEPDGNIRMLDDLVGRAAAQGAEYVLSPEVTVAFAENRDGLRSMAGPWDGNPAVARTAELARKHRVNLHLGSMAVALPDGRFANRSVLFRSTGEIAATYDKIHLFDATLPGVRAYRESETYRAGEIAVVTDAPGFRLGMTICYDVRFPALHRALAEAGAQVLSVPAAFTVPTGEAHWEVLLRARAIETGCFVVAAAQGGTHPNGRSTYGHSMIVDPWGKVVAEISGDRTDVLIADLDLGEVDAARARVPALVNARAFSIGVADTPAEVAAEDLMT